MTVCEQKTTPKGKGSTGAGSTLRHYRMVHIGCIFILCTAVEYIWHVRLVLHKWMIGETTRSILWSGDTHPVVHSLLYPSLDQIIVQLLVNGTVLGFIFWLGYYSSKLVNHVLI